MPSDRELARGTLEQFLATGDGCFLDNADADTLREMVRLSAAATARPDPGPPIEGEPADDEKVAYWHRRWFEACEQLDEVRQELARAEAVLVAADRLHDAYEAMLEKRDIGHLPEWERASLGEGEGER